MKKRFLALLLGASVLTSLSACSQSQPAVAPTTTAETEAVQGLFKPGTYQAEADGMNGPVKVEVTVDAEKIVSVNVLEHAETTGISDPAIERVPQAILDNQSIAVDTISGATITSTAILSAVKTALLDAGATEDAISTLRWTAAHQMLQKLPGNSVSRLLLLTKLISMERRRKSGHLPSTQKESPITKIFPGNMSACYTYML